MDDDKGETMVPIEQLERALQMTGHSYRLAKDAEAQALQAWIEEGFPVASWGRIAWEQVPQAVVRRWQSAADVAECLEEAAEGHWPSASEVAVVWTDASKPILISSLSGVVRHIERVLDVDWDVWVFAPEGTLLLEVYHEGEVAYGVRP